MIISDYEQGSIEWMECRLEIPTASDFKKIITSKGEISKQREKYLYQKAGEIVTGEFEDSYKNGYMDLGSEREHEARDTYAFVNDVDVEQVGFCYYDEHKMFGASPDGLVGKDGGFENKNAIASVQIDRLKNGWKGTEHKAQIQGCLLVTGREWWDLQSYCRGLKPLVIRFYRDEEFIKKLYIELRLFYREAQEEAKKWRIN